MEAFITLIRLTVFTRRGSRAVVGGETRPPHFRPVVENPLALSALLRHFPQAERSKGEAIGKARLEGESSCCVFDESDDDRSRFR